MAKTYNYVQDKDGKNGRLAEWKPATDPAFLKLKKELDSTGNIKTPKRPKGGTFNANTMKPA